MRAKKLPIKPSLSSFLYLHHNASLPTDSFLPPQPPRRREERGREGRGGDSQIWLRGASLPLHGPPAPPNHGHFHCSFCQAPSLLPRSLPLPPALPQFLLLTTRSHTSFSHSHSGILVTDDADLVADEIKEDGKDEVDRVCKLIDELVASDGDMEAALDQCRIVLTHCLVVRVLDRFRHVHKPAYRFFRWAGSVQGFTHDVVTYNKMLNVFGRNRQFGMVVEFLEEMGKMELLSMDSFKIAVRVFAASGEIKRCLWVFQLMKRFGFDVGLETFNCFLVILAKEKLAKEAQKLFDKMSGQGQYTPDIRTYTALLAGWCKVKNLVEAGRVWNDMLDRGIKPDIVAHNIMLQGLIHGQKRSEALKLFDLMKVKGPTPNAQTYTIIITALCKGRKMDLAIKVFDEMQVAGCVPNIATYTCLLTGFGNAGKMDQVRSLLRQIEEAGPVPDSSTYNAVIKLLTNCDMAEEAGQVYERMVQRGCEPTVRTYNMIMKSFFSKNHEMGCQIWEEMRKKGVCPDSNSYTVYIAGHIQHGRVREAERYILEMVNKGMKAPLIDYNKFVADFKRAGESKKLGELVQKMRSDGKFEAADWLRYRVQIVRVRREA